MLKVSVIVNCYNGSSYLKKTLESVINQSYQNWELIFWDNQSEDNSYEIFKDFKEKKFKYFRAKKHTSLHKARNLALRECSGDIIGFLDTDDYWSKSKLKDQIDIFERDPKVDCVYTKFWVKYENLFIPNKLITYKNLPEGKILDKLLNEYNFSLGSALFRKKKLENFPNVFSEKFDLISDFDFMIRFTKKNHLACVQKPLHYYRKHKNNMSLTNFKTQIEQMILWSANLKKENNFTNDQITKLKKHIDRMVIKFEIQKMTLLNFIKFIISGKKDISKFKSLVYFLFKKF